MINMCFVNWFCCVQLRFILHFFVDPCKKRVCEYYSRCVSRSDGTAVCVCPVCSKNDKISPVCGEDGKTYASQCELERVACEMKKDIETVKKEECGELSSFMICFLLFALKNM